MSDEIRDDVREPTDSVTESDVRYVRTERRPSIGERIGAKWRNFVDTASDGSVVWLCKRIAQWVGVFWRAVTHGLNKGLDRVAGRDQTER